MSRNDAPTGGLETVRRVRLGIWGTIGSIVVFTFAVALPGPERLPLRLYLALVLPATALALLFGLVPPRLISGPKRHLLFYAWSALSVGLISGTVAITGGGRSNLYLLYLVSLLFAANFYTVRAQATLGLATAGAYATTVAATGWHISLSVYLVRNSIMVLVTLIAGYTAAEKDRIAAESARRAALLTAVTGAARDVNLLEPAQVLEAVTQAMGQLGLQWGHVSLIDEEAGTYRLVQGRGIPVEYADVTPPASAGIIGMVREKRATVFLDNEAARTYVAPLMDIRRVFTAVIGAPLWVDGALAGALAGASTLEGGLRRDDVEAFELLAAIASRAIESARRFQEVTESEARSRHQAYHDDVTGLANRALLNVRLREALLLTGPVERQAALLIVDLYDFKLVNDTLGHATANKLLKEIATRLGECVRATDTVARLSGDEFAIVLPGFDHYHLGGLAPRLLRAVSEPTDVDGHNISVDASIGIAVKTAIIMNEEELDEAVADLMSSADVAMFEARRAGKHSHVLFDQAMSDRVRQRMAIGAELPRAIAAGEMTVFYQPIFDLCTRSITGFEALLRWSHPRLGSVPPSEFIPLAEDTGAIIPIGRWVLHQACAELQALRRENKAWSGLTMSVNLSTRQLRDPELVEDVRRTIRETEVPAAQLTLEITESSLVYDAATFQAKVAALGALGVQIALDDFGTGYSSLAYLQQLQVHCLKIDKSFVDGLDERNAVNDARTEPALIRSIAELSDALGLDTVAEGIETEGQLTELRHLGCHLGQGYVFSPAVPPARLRALLAQAAPRTLSLAAASPEDALPAATSAT